MKVSTLLALPALAAAYPGVDKETAASELEKRQSLNQVTNLVNDVSGIVGSVASSINPDNLRPEKGFVFKEPGPGDARGPCPGLNLLANYGYLPRNGYVNMGQVVEATSRGFNMGVKLSTILSIFAILSDGDPATESWSIGSSGDGIGGLNRHSTVEADISPNREDYYNACGDNHHLSSRIFKQNVEFVSKDPNKEFSYDVMRKQFSANSRFSQTYNPWIYYFPFPSIVSVVAFNFYPEYFSNGTYGAGGTANYKSISSIVGAKFDKKTGNFQYVPERWPERWYRRATPYDAVEALTDGFTRIYPANPVAMPFGQIGTPNLNVSTIICNLYQGLNSITPLALAGKSQAAQAQVSNLIGKLAGLGLDGTTLGCPRNSISANFLYPNATTAGGPLGPDLDVTKNNGNNVYYKTYHTEAPKYPKCKFTGPPKKGSGSGSGSSKPKGY
ncbi:Putative chloroperoxidase [Septoria linicola]|uniref:Chloroperoxidase n=1 Tax=Septoria linicola TaxID=215465 RepID=A0A9Q9AV48_9PEZI|nr:putative chloroperoxidase [Septoria linicola]USW51251.1 Putative chloroperoxidase [Septoria linicola]